jgi:hypothetical protein
VACCNSTVPVIGICTNSGTKTRICSPYCTWNGYGNCQ